MKKQILALSMVAGLVAGLVGITNAATLNVNGTVLATSCDVSITRVPSVQLTAATTDFGAAVGYVATKSANNNNPSQLTVKDCTGVVASGVTPSVVVSGDTISGQPKLFSNDPNGTVAVVVSPSSITATDGLGADYLATGSNFLTGVASTALVASGGSPLLANIFVAMAQVGASAPAAGTNVVANIDFVYNAE